MDDLYREYILDHYHNPRHKHPLDPADIEYEDDNPVCGDYIRITLRVDENDVVTEVGWEGDGCAISQASASMLYETLPGKTLDEIKQITPEEIYEMLGIPLSPVRVKCALLSLKVLKGGVYGLGPAPHEEDEGQPGR
ncbi:MAG: SUF system NifU family Fe-S cluster assembly protein [Anaerolineae bacterium]